MAETKDLKKLTIVENGVQTSLVVHDTVAREAASSAASAAATANDTLNSAKSLVFDPMDFSVTEQTATETTVTVQLQQAIKSSTPLITENASGWGAEVIITPSLNAFTDYGVINAGTKKITITPGAAPAGMLRDLVIQITLPENTALEEISITGHRVKNMPAYFYGGSVYHICMVNNCATIAEM